MVMRSHGGAGHTLEIPMKQVQLSMLSPGAWIQHPIDRKVTTVEFIQSFAQAVYDRCQHTVPLWFLHLLFPNRYWLDMRDYGTDKCSSFISTDCLISLVHRPEPLLF